MLQGKWSWPGSSRPSTSWLRHSAAMRKHCPGMTLELVRGSPFVEARGVMKEDALGVFAWGMAESTMSPRTATLIGLTAILMWSLLSVMTVATGRIPAFQLAAMTFAIGALVGFATWIGRKGAIGALR